MCLHCGWILLKCSRVCMIECNRNQMRNCTHFGHPSNEHSDIFIRDNQLPSVLTKNYVWTSVWCSRDHRNEMSASFAVMKELSLESSGLKLSWTHGLCHYSPFDHVEDDLVALMVEHNLVPRISLSLSLSRRKRKRWTIETWVERWKAQWHL